MLGAEETLSFLPAGCRGLELEVCCVVQEHLEQDKEVSCVCKEPLSTTQPYNGARMELEQGCCGGEIRQVGGCWLTHMEGLTAARGQSPRASLD